MDLVSVKSLTADVNKAVDRLNIALDELGGVYSIDIEVLDVSQVGDVEEGRKLVKVSLWKNEKVRIL